MKYQITATLDELRSIGCDELEINAIGEFRKDFNDGWLCLEFKNEGYAGGVTQLDIPKAMLKQLKP